MERRINFSFKLANFWKRSSKTSVKKMYRELVEGIKNVQASSYKIK